LRKVHEGEKRTQYVPPPFDWGEKDLQMAGITSWAKTGEMGLKAKRSFSAVSESLLSGRLQQVVIPFVLKKLSTKGGKAFSKC